MGGGGGGGGGISGRVRALNLTVPLGSGRVGSDNLGYGPGSGFSFEPVQTSSSLGLARERLNLSVMALPPRVIETSVKATSVHSAYDRNWNRFDL